MNTMADSKEMESAGEVDDVDARGLFGISRRTEPKYGTLTVAVDSDVYNMDHSSRGKCVIFNNKDFEEHTKLNERKGTDADALYLYRCFRNLDFEVALHTNFSRKEILDELKKVSKENHTNNDAFVCIILSHGDQGVLFGCDGKFRVEEIYTPFLGDMCVTLAGKPKLFFIQACQGDRLDSGTELRGMESADGPSSYKIPVFADLLIAYSTVPGFYSWRNTTRGSWFIQALCSVFEKYGKEKDVLEMLTMVNRKVCYEFESCVPNSDEMDRKKQVPCITSMLTRKVYFTPKN